MSKFSDRLKRLHDSRVRASAAAEEAEETRAGVYHADDVAELEASPTRARRSHSKPPSDRQAERDAWKAVGASNEGDVFWLDNHLDHAQQHGRYPIAALQDLTLADISRDVLGLFAAEAEHRDTRFIDIESAGLGPGPGNEAWCVGIGQVETDGFGVRHFLLPHPDLERAMLQAVADRLTGAKLLVSFNGAAFDLPRLRGHFERHGIEDPTERVDHIDLLKVVRRLLPRDSDTSLTGTERQFLGFERRHDVPGAESPRRWARYLRTLNVRPLLPLVEHNKLDIVSLAMLLVHCQRALTDGRPVVPVDRSKPLPTPSRRERAPGPVDKAADPTSDADRGEPSEFRKKLVRSYRLKNKGTTPQVRRSPRREPEKRVEPVGPAASPQAPVGERLTQLRRAASSLLERGDVDEAVPLLHEMLAISPRNPFPLAELARYYRDAGDDDLANLFESRLRDVAPY